jgi:hypothetical protein
MSPESYVSLRKSGAAPAAIGIDGNIGIVLPGPYERCVPEVIAGGGDDLR